MPSTPSIIASSSGDFLFTGMSLYYSSTCGLYPQKINLFSRDPLRPSKSLLSNEYIKDITTSKILASYSFLTSTNRMFYGSFTSINAFEIQSGESYNSISMVRFLDGGNKLSILNWNVNYPFLIKRDIPILNELTNVALFPR